MRHSYLVVLFLFLLTILSCSSSSSSSDGGGGGGGGNQITVSIAAYMTGTVLTAGMSDVGTDTIFVATFSNSVSTSGLEDNFFIVAGAKADTSSTSYDATICNPSSALPATKFDCGGSEPSTTCSLQASSFLTPNTQYTLCISSSVSPVGNYTFSGSALTFTTANDSAATDSCTDTTATSINLFTAVPFDFSAVGYMSKFRSCSGHSYQDSLEQTPYTSQKHYICALTDLEGCNNDVAVYAAFDGVIIAANTDSGEPDCDDTTNHDGYVYLQSSAHPMFVVEYGDVNPYTGISVGDIVTSGQRIGTATYPDAASGCWDLQFMTVTYYDSVNNIPTIVPRSHCEIGAFLSGTISAAFTSHNASSDNMKFTKTYRDEHNCTLSEQQESGDYNLSPASGETDTTQRVIFTQ